MFSLNVMTRRNQVTINVQMQPGDSARNHHEEGDHTGSHSIPIPVNAEIRDPFWSYSVGMKMGNIPYDGNRNMSKLYMIGFIQWSGRLFKLTQHQRSNVCLS